MEKAGDILKKIIDSALAAVDPVHLVLENLRLEGNRLFIKGRPFDLSAYNKIHVLGVGKGATFLWEGLDQVLGNRISGGVIVSLAAHRFTHPTVTFFPGSHPVPDQTSFKAGLAMVQYIKKNIREKDLVFFLITGGASALMVQPEEGVSLEDKMAITQLLLECGADINEINCVRKSLSAIKGGKLAQIVYPAPMVSLVLSDIIDSPLGDIGSGPSIPHHASIAEAYRILKNRDLIQHLPGNVKRYYTDALNAEQKQKRNSVTETHPLLTGNAHFLLADNRIALEEAKTAAEEMGIATHILTSRDRGEAAEVAKLYAAIIKEIIYTGTPFKAPLLLLSGGELTVTLTPPPGQAEVTGKGGRNQAFIMQLLKELKTIAHPFYAASIGTDGIDGPTDAAGAWINQETMTKVKELGLDTDKYQQNHDSYHFFKELKQLIITGPTRTNVMDLRMFYIPERKK